MSPSSKPKFAEEPPISSSTTGLSRSNSRSALSPLDRNARVASSGSSLAVKDTRCTRSRSNSVECPTIAPSDRDRRRSSITPLTPVTTSGPGHSAGHMLQVAAEHTATFLFHQVQIIHDHVMPTKATPAVCSIGSDGGPAIDSWNLVESVSVRFRAGLDGHEGCNAWVLSVQDLNAGRAKALLSATVGSETAQSAPLQHSLQLDTTLGEPAVVTLVLRDGRQRVALVSGMSPGEVSHEVFDQPLDSSAPIRRSTERYSPRPNYRTEW